MKATLLALLLVAGCGIFDEKPAPSTDEAAKTEPPAPDATPPVPEPETVAPTAPMDADHYRALIVLDTTVDRAFFVPEDAVQSGLEGKNILYLHAYSAETPFAVTDSAGKVLGTIDIKTITDLKTGYIFVEAGRPSDYVAPAAIPFVFQQASAYFKEPLRASQTAMNGQRAGRRAGGAGGKQINPRLKERVPVKGPGGNGRKMPAARPGVNAVKSGEIQKKSEE